MAAPDLSFSPDFAGSKQYAVMYRQCGIQVVPARYPMVTREDKRPALAGWKEFQNGLINDGLFETWFPQATTKPNMGLITGRASGNIFVVDLDEHSNEAARLWWQGLLQIENYGQELETWSQVTGGGGRQLFFRAPPDWHAPTNRTPIGVDIRGQGGFAMLPPSLHLSGKEYEWAPGCAPYEIEVLDAPQWLLDAVDRLVEQYGGDNGSNSGGERTPSPATDFDAFGARVDGREDALAKWVWGAVVGLYRDTNGVYPADHGAEAFQASLEAWLRHARTRLAGVSNAEGLERECRGTSAFTAKWARAVQKWKGRVAEDAARPRPGAEAPKAEPAPPPVDPATGRPRPLILTAAEFVAGFSPPDYLIDGMMQRSYLYSLTARTGHGKTAVGMFIAQAVARGEALKKRGVRQGSVLYLAGENPDDIRARFMILADQMGFDPAEIPIRFIAGVVDIEAELPRIRAEAADITDLVLVIVDTAAAYFKGDDGNSNVQQGAYARLLREFTFLPSKPAGLVMAHPVKNAGKDNLSPVGGGAFLNEVDGNLTLWANAEKQTTLHWQGKFRGPEFEPITFRLDTVTSDRVHDSDGQLMPSVVAVPISDMEMEAGERTREADENVVLLTLLDNPRPSIARLATLCRFVSETGEPHKSKAFRILRSLAEDKLVEMVRGKYQLTPKGKKEVEGDDD